MASLGAVLDDCVLYPPRLRDTLLRAAEYGLYRVQWSEEILDELLRNLIQDAHLTEDQATTLIAAMRDAFEFATVSGYAGLIDAMPTHPKDSHVAAAAIASDAQVIVTQNLGDFPADSLAPFGVQVQSPDTFLMHLFALDPETMVRIIEEQAARLSRPPLSAEYILGRLSLFAPTFVQLVRERRGSLGTNP